MTGQSGNPESVVVGGGVHGDLGAIAGHYMPATKDYGVNGAVNLTDHLSANAAYQNEGGLGKLAAVGARYRNGNFEAGINYRPEDKYYSANMNYRF